MICSEGCFRGGERQERGFNSRRVEEGRLVWTMVSHLCEGEPSLVVDLEDLLDGVHIGSCPQVQTEVVLARCSHDLLQKKMMTQVIHATPPSSTFQWMQFPGLTWSVRHLTFK